MNATTTGLEPLRVITEDIVDDIALGAAVLGTGGGGDPHIGALIAKRQIRLHGPVTLLSVEDLDDEGLVLPIGAIGAPSVTVERVMAESELRAAVQGIQRVLHRRTQALMPIEVGGGNSMLPIAASAQTGLRLLDADAMGRAFPESQMVTFHLAGHSPGTTIVVDHHGNEMLGRPVDGVWSERLARALTVEMGGNATMIDYVHPGSVVREVAIAGTMSLAYHIGRILRRPHEMHGDGGPVQTLVDELGAYRLFEGKVTDLQREVRGGFTRGAAHLEGTATDKGDVLRLDFQNEMLLARRNGEVAAVTPDLIAVLDQVTGHPITTENLRYGARCVVIGLRCDPWWRTPIGLETAGPGYFGYDIRWTPIEELNPGAGAGRTPEELQA